MRNELSKWILEKCELLSENGYTLTLNSLKDLDNFIEYTNHKEKRKIRIHTKQNRGCDIEIVDLDFFPLDLNLLYAEMSLQNPHYNNPNVSPKFLINNFLQNFNEIAKFRSYKNKKYYFDKLNTIRNSSQYSNEFGCAELIFINHLVKEYAESTIIEQKAQFAELGLILLAIIKPLDIRDLLTSAILINCSLKEIGENPLTFFEKYKSKNYNVNIELFEKMIKQSNILTEKDGGYSLEIGDGAEYKSQYYKQMNSYEEWYTYDNM